MLLVTGGAGFIGSNFVLSTIVEIGRHTELLAQDGVYARLYRIQYSARRAAA